MDKNRSKVFGTFTYDESMTYYDLLAAEEGLKGDLDKIFLDAGAEHLDFTPLGDMLMFQCAFEEPNADLFRDLAGKCAAITPKNVAGRFMFLEKDLTSGHLFWIKRGQWQEDNLDLPRKAPEGAKVHEVKPREEAKAPEGDE